MAETCLVLLCGIPAVGKTSFAKRLQDTKGSGGLRNPCYIIVEYDKLLPPELEQSLILPDDQQQSKWKSYRANIVKCVDSLLEYIENHESAVQDSTLPNKPTEEVSQELWEKFLSMVETTSPWQHDGNKKTFIVIDDNMFYRSMRYSYYQLARKYQMGFCQIYLHTDTETAICQNATRVVKVTDDVITTMATKMEVPDGTNNSWEENSITISPTEDLKPVFELYNKALTSPVQPVEEVDVEQQAQSRVVCSENFLYQSDQILRKMVSQQMALAKERHLTKPEMKSLAGCLQTSRKRLLDDLKSGSVCVPNDLVALMTDSCKDTNSALFLFLENKFNTYFKEIKR